MATCSIRYQLLQPSQHEEAIRFVLEQFMPHEPVNKCLGFDKNKNKINEAEMSLLASCFEGNLSWCAVDHDSNKMVGLQLNSVLKYEDLPDEPVMYDGYVALGLSHNSSIQLELEEQVSMAKQILKQRNEEKVLQLLLLATHSDYKKLGIGSGLAIRSLEHGIQESGCHLAMVTCSSFYTQKIFGDKLHFEAVGEKKYADYVFKGEHILANVEPPHKSIIIYVKTV